MTASKLGAFVALGLITAFGALIFGPWYETAFATAAIASAKVVGLFLTAVAAFAVVRSGGARDPNRRNWMIFGAAFTFYGSGQCVLFYHQTVLGDLVPFPSLGDPFFVAYGPLAVFSLLSFSRAARRSGLSLGSPLAFWWPALVVLSASFVALPFLLGPIARAGGSAVELGLNIYYPVLSFVTLAPCAVILRFGIKFRGGRVFWVWLTITAGYLLILFADILYAYVSMLEMGDLNRVLDFSYVAGYILIPRGVLYQRELSA